MNMYLPVGHNCGTRNEVSGTSWSLPSGKAQTLLVALKLPGVGPVAVRKFASALRDTLDVSPSAALYRDHGLLRDEKDYSRAFDSAEKVMEKCFQKEVFIISLLDDQYPIRLRKISDAPPVIYVVGAVEALQKQGCAVVGTRHASDYGARIAFRISGALVERDMSVVSGLALGIDTAAHEGALAGNGTTVAIMAHGLDTVAPSSNRKLAVRILDKGGALVSEHEPGTPPRPAEFVRRNRIQSGMSFCSIIVESGEQGGSMHQARFTRNQGKPVLAVLPENENGALRGFNHEGGKLLVSEHGAARIRNIDDLLTQIDQIIRAAPASEQASHNPRLT